MKYLLFITFSLLLGCSPTPSKERLRGTIAEHGMVVTAHHLASKVGADILKKGGNAFDAAIAVQFALAVVYPRAGNIGGGGFMVYRKADGQTGTLDFREKAPQAAHRDMYLNAQGEVIAALSLKGPLAAGVPGTVDGMIEIYKKLGGKLPFADLVQPSIDLAEKGFPLTANEVGVLNRHQADFKELNGEDCHLYKAQGWNIGDTIVHKALARTLTLVREHQRAGFYEGETAQAIVAAMGTKGMLSLNDLQRYRSVWREAIWGNYRGYRIISMLPPSSGGIALLQLLKGAEAYTLKKMGHNSAETAHLYTELARRVYADRATHLGDPDFYQVPQQLLLSKRYIQQRMSDIRMDAKTSSQSIKAGAVNAIESFETTHFSIVDKEGNAVAITTTLNGNFGCKVVAAGFLLNNEMDDFSVKPGVPNQFGLVGGEANAIAPNKRMLSSMTPTIVEKDGKLFMVVGTPGSTIIMTVFQTILNVTDFGMSMQEAVNAKKMHAQWLPDRIYYEEGAFSETALLRLKTLGHEMEKAPILGKMEAILVLPNGKLEGAPDYTKGDDSAAGY